MVRHRHSQVAEHPERLSRQDLVLVGEEARQSQAHVIVILRQRAERFQRGTAHAGLGTIESVDQRLAPRRIATQRVRGPRREPRFALLEDRHQQVACAVRRERTLRLEHQQHVLAALDVVLRIEEQPEEALGIDVHLARAGTRDDVLCDVHRLLLSAQHREDELRADGRP